MPMRRSTAASLLVAVALLTGCSPSPYPVVEVDMTVKAAPPQATAQADRPVLRFSIAAIQSPQDTFAAYSRFIERMGEKLGMQVAFVQRRTYGEVNDLLLSGQVDAALVCTGGYLDLERRAPGTIEVLAAPMIGGATTYQSLLIVPASSKARALGDLKGGRFAFTDELSFSGHLYPLHLLSRAGTAPSSFFGSVTFTRSHDRSIEGVLQGVIDGASVDSLVYDALLKRDPRVAAGTRVIHRSPPFGLMPVVASTRMPPEARRRLQAVLLDLHLDRPSAAALALVGIERFVVPEPGLYDGAAAVAGKAK